MFFNAHMAYIFDENIILIVFFTTFTQLLQKMPLLKTNFSPVLPLKNPHFNTVYRSLFMKDIPHYKRTRIATWDHDFIDLDFSFVKSKTLVLLCAFQHANMKIWR